MTTNERNTYLAAVDEAYESEAKRLIDGMKEDLVYLCLNRLATVSPGLHRQLLDPYHIKAFETQADEMITALKELVEEMDTYPGDALVEAVDDVVRTREREQCSRLIAQWWDYVMVELRKEEPMRMWNETETVAREALQRGATNFVPTWNEILGENISTFVTYIETNAREYGWAGVRKLGAPCYLVEKLSPFTRRQLIDTAIKSSKQEMESL